MKKTMKKALIGVASFVLSFSALAGIGTTFVSAQENKISVTADGQILDYLQANIADFTEKTGIEVEFVERDMFETLEGLALDGPSGNGTDVMIAPFDRIGSLGMTGQLAPVTLNEEAGFTEDDAQLVTINDQIYGAPVTIEALVLFYNKDLVEKAPQTFEELETLAKDEKYAFASEEGKTVGFLANWTDFYSAYGLLSGYGGYVFGDNGQNPEDIGLNNEGSVEALNYAKQWYDMWPQGMQDTTSAADFVNQSFQNGETAAVIGGPWFAGQYAEAGVNYGVAKIPTLNNSESYKPFGGGKAWVISNYSENKENAQQFLDWVTSDEQQKAFYEATKEIPANQNVRAEIAESDDELSRAVIETFTDAVPMPNIPQMAEVWDPAANMMFEAVSGTKDAKTAADDAVQLIKDQIAQKY